MTCSIHITGADSCQAIFNTGADTLASFEVSRHRLTQNLRNTEPINDWLGSLVEGGELRCTCRAGFPVGFFPWQKAEEELQLVVKELGRLVSQRVRPGRVVILSPLIKENREKSCFAGRDKIGEWALVDAGARLKGDPAPPANAVKFYTIRSFKGLEADIVFLTGIRSGSKACTVEDIYVGSSRARILLYIFHEDGYEFGP